MAWNNFDRSFEQSLPSHEKTLFRQNKFPEVYIKDLNVGLVDFRVCGIIILKESAKSVVSKNSASGGTNERGVLSLTIRDSLCDFINVAFWAKVDFAREMDSSLPLGTAVTVFNPQVKIKQSGSRDEAYRAETPSRYYLLCSEQSSSIETYRGPRLETLRSLRSMVISKPSQHCKINQMLQYFNNKRLANKQLKEYFTFFALVKKVSEPKELLSRFGRQLVRCEVTLCDDSCNSFPLVLWEPSWINEASRRWIPFETTLSLVSCSVKFDDFRRGVIGSADGKTIIIKDPDTDETMNLKRAGQKSRMAREMQAIISEDSSGPIGPEKDNVPLESIHSVVTVECMKRREGQAGLSSENVYGIVFAAITKMDIDASNPQSFLTFRCPNCHKRVDKERAFICTTAECPMVGQDLSGADNVNVEADFNTVVHVTDHTGTESRCILGDQAMSDLLQMKPEEFAALPSKQRSCIKWQHMFRRFKIYFRASLPSFDRPNPFTVILRCAPINVSEALTSFSSR